MEKAGLALSQMDGALTPYRRRFNRLWDRTRLELYAQTKGMGRDLEMNGGPSSVRWACSVWTSSGAHCLDLAGFSLDWTTPQLGR